MLDSTHIHPIALVQPNPLYAGYVKNSVPQFNIKHYVNLLHDFHKPRICEIQLGWRQQFQLGHCNENKREYKLQKKRKK